jgi:hypothetical protein
MLRALRRSIQGPIIHSIKINQLPQEDAGLDA